MEPRSDEALAQRFEAALDRTGAPFTGSFPVQAAAAQMGFGARPSRPGPFVT